MNIYLVKRAWGFWAFILLAAPLMGRTEAWRQERMQVIEDSKSLPPQERIPILGSVVTAGYPDRMMPPNEIQLEVAATARGEMLAIPGHAEYYRDRINEARRKLDAEPPDSVDRGPLQSILYNEQSAGFRTLSQLPSAETVRVLGEFLFDDRGSRPEVAEVEIPISRDAATALSKLPLVGRPVTAMESGRDDIPTWRLWYQQVRAGTRTIRFVGDPKEYNLRDLMRQSATADPNPRPPRHAANDRPPAGPARNSKTDTPSSAIWPILIAAELAVLAALWYFLRLRKGRRI